MDRYASLQGAVRDDPRRRGIRSPRWLVQAGTAVQIVVCPEWRAAAGRRTPAGGRARKGRLSRPAQATPAWQTDSAASRRRGRSRIACLQTGWIGALQPACRVKPMDAGRQGRRSVERQSMRLAAASSTGANRPASPTPRLPVRRSRHAPGAHPPSQARVDPGAAQGSRVAQAIESNDCAHPMDINRPRPYAGEEIAKALASRVGHLHRFQGRPRWRAAFDDL